MKRWLSVITILLFTLGVFAQSNNLSVTCSEVAPETELGTRASLKLQFEFSIPSDGTAAIASDGKYFYLPRHNKSTWTKLNLDGTQAGENFQVSGLSNGLVSLTYDGRYFWGANQTTTLYKIDMEANPPKLAGTVASPIKALRCSYDATADNGNGGFWIGDFTSDLVLINREGVQLDVISASKHGLKNVIGSVCDNVSEGGPYFWGQTAATSQPVYLKQIKLPEGTPIGYTYNMTGTGYTASGYGGGLCIMENLVEGTATLICINQNNKAMGFELAGLKTFPLDIGVSSINLQNTFAKGDDYEISGKVTNYGTSTINSFKINYQIDNGPVESYDVTDLNLAKEAVYNFKHPKKATPTEGNHSIRVWTSLPNGEEDDDDYNDDVVSTYIIYDPDNTVPRLVLLEGFTSSTCGPCVAGNNNLKNIISQSDGNLTLIKYQCNFPGNGDPYYTAEVGTMMSYYSVNSVPTLIGDGKSQGSTSTFTLSKLQALQKVPAFIKLEAEFYVNEKTVTATAKVNPLFDISEPDIKLFMAIVEKTTTKNKGTNGEASFNQVMKKFMPNTNGIALGSLEGNVASSFNQTWEFQGNYRLPSASNPVKHDIEHSIEDFENLEVVAWLQNVKTKEIYQSCTGTLATAGSVTYQQTGENGSVTATVNGEPLEQGAVFEIGTEIKFVATPNRGYAVKAWKVNGIIAERSVSNEFIFVFEGAYADVEAEFTEAPGYVFYKVVGENGALKVSVDGSEIESITYVDPGKEVVFAATPAEDYQVKQWTVNGKVEGGNTSNELKVTMGEEAPLIVEVAFTKGSPVRYEVVNEHGALEARVDGYEIVSESSVEHGKTVVFTAVPNEGYEVKEWKVNNEIKDGNTSNELQVTVGEEELYVTVEFQQTVGIAPDTFSNTKIYPNPVKEEFRIENGELAIASVQLFDINGRLVFETQNAGATGLTVNIRDLSKGIYLVVVHAVDGQKGTYKIVKE